MFSNESKCVYELDEIRAIIFSNYKDYIWQLDKLKALIENDDKVTFETLRDICHRTDNINVCANNCSHFNRMAVKFYGIDILSELKR